MTEKLYYRDSNIKDFSAEVIGVEKRDDGYSVLLDKTAFFPEGGGQSADTGTIDDAEVTDVFEQDGLIFHITEKPVTVGTEVSCAIDWETRFRRMQNHTGEHILSGIVHRLFGFENVGFHLGSESVTIDFDGFVDKDSLRRVEYLANEAVYKNVSVYSSFPGKKELETIVYRSKKEIDGAVRLVHIDGYDVCACCAPHVSRTGEIGIIKILGSEKYKGGVRLYILCGFDALEDVNKKYDNNAEISSLLSAKPNETADAVLRVLNEHQSEKRLIAEQKSALAALTADSLKETQGNICVFTNGFDYEALRIIVNKGVDLCPGVCAAFSGCDENGYIYIAGSKRLDMQKASKKINAALLGRGGGKPEMIQGSLRAERKVIESYFYNLKVNSVDFV